MGDQRPPTAQRENRNYIAPFKQRPETAQQLSQHLQSMAAHSVMSGADRPAIPPTSHQLLFLQRTIGNQAVNRLVQARVIGGEKQGTDGQEADIVSDAESPTDELAHTFQQEEMSGDGQTKPRLNSIAPYWGKSAGGQGHTSIWSARSVALSTAGEGHSGIRSAQATAAGEPTISVTQKAKSLTKCGSAEYAVRWSVSGKKSNGWIIQHIKWRAKVTDCKGKNRAPNNPDGLEFWEGWEVKGGQVYVGFASGGTKHSADTFRTVDEGAKTKGTVTITGKVRFIAGYKLKTPPWGYTVPQAGSLPTMTARPKGWSDSGANSHTMKVVWNCCGKKSTQKVTARP